MLAPCLLVSPALVVWGLSPLGRTRGRHCLIGLYLYPWLVSTLAEAWPRDLFRYCYAA